MITSELTTHILTAEPVTAEAFAPYGAVLAAGVDGSPCTDDEGMLDLTRGRPRIYVMALEDKPAAFTRITRHRAVTQCLASVGGAGWLIAVAPPTAVDDSAAVPALAEIRAYVVPGDVVLLLARGTWHAGPFFAEPSMSFFNLELADTNVVDHQSYRLDESLGVRVSVV